MVGGGIYLEIDKDIYTLLYIKQITNKNLVYSTRNSTQHSVMTYVAIKSKERGYICITGSFC